MWVQGTMHYKMGSNPHGRGRHDSDKTVMPPFVKLVWTLAIIRLHCLHAVHEMRPIATDVARSVVCVFDTLVSCEKNG